jgi:hypothetical protein
MIMTKPIIAMLTDFGSKDIYVGVMKGVIKRICPDAEFIDLTHDIAPQDVAAGAWALKNAVQHFPAGTIFLCIVDPDVGSNRFPLAVQAGDYMFIAPDNGVLTHVLRDIPMKKAVNIQNRQYALPKISDTFHGRDIFSPAAAHLANGVPLEVLGGELVAVQSLTIPDLEVESNSLRGAIVHIDHFGNIITNLGAFEWAGARELATPHLSELLPASKVTIMLGTHHINGIVRAYYEVPEGQLLAQIDSTGVLEIAIYRGNAAHYTSARVGDAVTILW